MAGEKQVLFEGDEVIRAIARIAHEVIEKTGDPRPLVLIGIRSRGVHLARRIARTEMIEPATWESRRRARCKRPLRWMARQWFWSTT
jgi:pyrimidine operon attenuation protein/uracil phosphoribosyltransferase